MTWLIVIILLLWAVTRFYLKGEDLRPYDQPIQAPFKQGPASADHKAVIEALGGFSEEVVGVPRKKKLKIMRDYMDGFGDDVAFEGDIIPWNDGVIKGEWLIAPGADTTRRMLYIHGGAWVMGSPRSHRAITARFAKMIGGAVFSLDYRLMPESQRISGIEDCQYAYRWLLDNGPNGPEAAKLAYVAGDSAGGNLTLALIAWIRDRGLRAPDAAVALSPATDGTFNSPSMKTNIATDHMLGPEFGKLNRVPKWMLLWFNWFNYRIPPSAAVVSPAFGDLSRLPPVLVHASEAEMLLDDGRRYVNKAQAHGSPALLQTWPDVVHVWHIFEDSLPEANEAFEQIHQFLEREGSLPVLGTPS
jgi:monoterpene epsilon-lactone hydrolase